MVDAEVTVEDRVEGANTANVDSESLVGVGGKTVVRQRVQIAGGPLLNIAAVLNSAPTTEYGVVTRNIPSGTQPVSGTVSANLNAGTNNIGDVDVLTLPALVASTANIGDVDVLTLPAIPAGTNNIGDVDIASLPTSATSSAPAQTAQGTTSAQILASNASRKRVMVQNTGTTIIKLNLGATAVTQTAYHVSLQACAAADDGSGGAYIDEMWTGAIQAISSAAGGTLVIVELT